MNAISYAVKHIKWAIPKPILNVILNHDVPKGYQYLTSIDELIVSKIIRPKVMVDANIVGGVEDLIPLSGLNIIQDRYNASVVVIPPDRTMNRSIISVLGVASTALSGVPGVSHWASGMGNFDGYQQDGLPGCIAPTYAVNQAGRIYDSHRGAESDLNVHTDLIGPNTVLIYGLQIYNSATLGLKVMLENDSNLNNIKPRSYVHFAELCLLATKSYLYNEYVIDMDRGELDGGMELGRFANIVDGYDTSFEDYHTYLTTAWARVAAWNDEKTRNDIITINSIINL